MPHATARPYVRGLMCCVLTLLAICTLAACRQTTGVTGGTGNMSAPGPTHGVVVEVGAATYHVNDTINVNVKNALTADITATDHQTSCTIVQLQMQTSTGWQNQGGCAMGTPTRRMPMKAVNTTAVALSPSAGQISAKPWPAGTYRVAFTYQIGEGASETVVSSTFTIG